VLPVTSWTDHTLPVRAVVCGAGGAACRIFTAALDHTCKVRLRAVGGGGDVVRICVVCS